MPERWRWTPLNGWRARLVEWGLVKPARDFAAYQRALRERGLVTRLVRSWRFSNHSADWGR